MHGSIDHAAYNAYCTYADSTWILSLQYYSNTYRWFLIGILYTFVLFGSMSLDLRRECSRETFDYKVLWEFLFNSFFFKALKIECQKRKISMTFQSNCSDVRGWGRWFGGLDQKDQSDAIRTQWPAYPLATLKSPQLSPWYEEVNVILCPNGILPCQQWPDNEAPLILQSCTVLHPTAFVRSHRVVPSFEVFEMFLVVHLPL